MLFNLVVVLGTLVAMEGVGTLAHKYIMHGWGWWLHRSHHEPQLGMLETNDFYLLALALIAAGLVAFGKAGHAPLQWVGAGVAGYGVLYVIFHDGLFHRHWPFKPTPLSRYLRRLHYAHRLHHARRGRKNSVSFGFFYAPPPSALKSSRAPRAASCKPIESTPPSRL